MWDLAVREEDYEAAEAMIERYSHRAPLSFRIPPAYAQNDTTTFSHLRETARNLDARQSQIAAKYVATYLEDFAVAEELARLDLQPRRNAAIRLGAQTFLAWLEAARGRWVAASAAFDTAARMDGGHVIRTERAMAATLPFLDVPRADVEAIRRTLEVWDPVSEQAPAVGGLGPALRPHLRLYLLGLLSARLGDDERALRHALELERLPGPSQMTNVIRGLAATVRADVAHRHGRHQEVLDLLQVANGEVPLELVFMKPFVTVREYTQEHARYLRIESLLGLGRHEAARAWLVTSFQGSSSEHVYLAPMHERLGRLAAQRGDRSQGIDHYRRFITLWRNSDPPLQKRLLEAEAAVNRLSP